LKGFKISFITVIYNAENTIARCTESVISQDDRHFEYVIVDGGSTDGTLPIISKCKNRINVPVAESGKDIYPDSISRFDTGAKTNAENNTIPVIY